MSNSSISQSANSFAAWFIMAAMACSVASCVKNEQPSDKVTVSETCQAAQLIVKAEEERMNEANLQEPSKLELVLCRQLPGEQSRQALLVVISTRSTTDGLIEDAFTGRLLKDPETNWRLTGTSSIYSNLTVESGQSEQPEQGQ